MSRPGVERGDITFTAEDLPKNIKDWKLVNFSPASPVENLPERQVWWTHTWNYTQNHLHALVSIDQANWNQWHELTECYRGAGWELVHRKLHDAETKWPFVVAKLQKQNHYALLAFSLAFPDGTILTPPDWAASEANPSSALDRFTARLKLQTGPQHADPNMRAVQYQVLVTTAKAPTTQDIQLVIALHRQARKHLQMRVEKLAKPNS